MHDSLFANQKELSREDLDARASQLRLDLAKWKAALDGGVHRSKVDADLKAGTDINVPGTPFFLVNNYVIYGVPTAVRLRRIIERALADVKARR